MSDARLIALVAVAHLVSHFLQLALPPLFPVLRTTFDVPYVALGLVITVFFAASGLGQTAAGFLVDRLGARRVLLAGMTLFSLATATEALVPGYRSLVLVALLAGLGNSVFHPADYALFNAAVSPARLARAYGAHAVLGNLGWDLAPVVVTAVSEAAGWRAALLVAGGLGLGATLAVAVGTRPVARWERSSRPMARPLGAELRLLLGRPILAAFAYFLLLSTSLIGLQTFSVSALVAIYGVPVALASGTLTGFLLGNAAGVLAGGVLADAAHRPARLAAAGLLLATASTVAVGTGVLPVTLLVAAMTLAGGCVGVTTPARDLLVRGATPPGASGKVFGFVYSGLDVGALLAPPLYGWLLDRGVPHAVFLSVAVLMLLTAGTIGAVRPAARLTPPAAGSAPAAALRPRERWAGRPPHAGPRRAEPRSRRTPLADGGGPPNAAPPRAPGALDATPARIPPDQSPRGDVSSHPRTRPEPAGDGSRFVEANS